MNAFEILVIILSATLAVFLVLSIVAVIMFIALLRGMRNVPERLNSVVDQLGEVSSAVRDTAAPLIMLGNLIKKVFPGKKRS
jgi:membrane protein implicated in regulation of membrane protease activity